MSGISFRFSVEIKILSPLYWMPSTVLMLSPTVLKLSATVLNSLHSAEGIPDNTEAIPHIYCSYPPTVLKVSLQSVDVISPQYWYYHPHVLMLFQLHWTTSTVLKLFPTVLKLSPTALMLPQCTEQPPPEHWIKCYMGWVSLNSPLAFSQLPSISLFAQLNAHSTWSHLQLCKLIPWQTLISESNMHFRC